MKLKKKKLVGVVSVRRKNSSYGAEKTAASPVSPTSAVTEEQN